MLICPSCDWENDDSDVVCMGCGYPIGNEDPDYLVPEEPKKQVNWWEVDDETPF